MGRSLRNIRGFTPLTSTNSFHGPQTSLGGERFSNLDPYRWPAGVSLPATFTVRKEVEKGLFLLAQHGSGTAGRVVLKERTATLSAMKGG
jgi:hypothetical protein